MHQFRRARVPLACLPPALATPEAGSDPRVEPWREVDIAVEGRRITAVTLAAQASAGSRPAPKSAAAPAAAVQLPGAAVTDLAGAVVFPGLIDVHTHLDKAHTWGRSPNPRGEFWDAITILGADSARWTQADLHRRADFALRRAWAHGTAALRTHLDTGAEIGENAHAVVQQLRSEWAERLTLQTVSLCNVESFAKGDAARIVELTARYKATALGGFPQPNPDLPRQFDYLMAAARELGVGLDLHVDESGLPGAECLRAVAEAVLRNQFPFPVACGHCCSLSVQAPERQQSTIDLVKAAGVQIIALPLCNSYLQGRTRAPSPIDGELGAPRTPQWRGVTLLHEFIDAGVTVACASDNVRDAFYAWGDLDVAEIYVESLRIAQLDTRLAASPAIVTTGPAAIMGLHDAGQVAPGARADLVVFAARTFNELLATASPARRLIHGEGFRPAVRPDYAELD